MATATLPTGFFDASGAEAWALSIVIRTCNFFPRVITDCLNLLSFHQAGQIVSGASHKPLARLWNMIFPLCLSYASELVVNKLLTWMPAHKSASSIGQQLKSDGNCVTAIDWRANRLVDCLARLAARCCAVPDAAVNIFNEARQAAEFCAAWLWTVTFAANHHKVLVASPAGIGFLSTRRDSAPGKRPRRTMFCIVDEAPRAQSSVIQCSVAGGVKRSIQLVDNPNLPPLNRSHAASYANKVRSAEKAHSAVCNEAFWKSWHERRASQPSPTTPSVCAADRMEAIRRRLRNAV